MTTQPTEAPAVALELLVGEMPTIPCEHSQHGVRGYEHNDAPASHYLQAKCPQCGYVSEVFAACPAYVASIVRGDPSHCRECKTIRPANTALTILGPVKS